MVCHQKIIVFVLAFVLLNFTWSKRITTNNDDDIDEFIVNPRQTQSFDGPFNSPFTSFDDEDDENIEE